RNCHHGSPAEAARSRRSEALGLNRLRADRTELGHVVGSRLAQGGGGRSAREVQIRKVYDGSQLLRHRMRCVRSLWNRLVDRGEGQWPARQGGGARRLPQARKLLQHRGLRVYRWFRAFADSELVPSMWGSHAKGILAFWICFADSDARRDRGNTLGVRTGG